MKRLFAVVALLLGAMIFTTSPTLAQAPANCEGAAQIQFQPGATSAVVDGQGSSSYFLNAGSGQRLAVSVNGVPQNPSKSVTLTVFGADGTVLQNGNMSGSNVFQGNLPSSQDYCLSVGNNSQQKIVMIVSVL